MSTVIISGLPFNCQESDIHRALLMYGTAIDIQLNTRQQQAYVTMRTQMEAQALLNRKAVNVLGTTARVDAVPQVPQVPQLQSADNAMYGENPYAYQQQLQHQQYSDQQQQQQQQPPYQVLQQQQHQQQQVYQQAAYQPQPPQAMYQPQSVLPSQLLPQPLPQQQQPPPPPPLPQPQPYPPYSESRASDHGSRNYGQSVFPAHPPIYGSGGLKSPRLRLVVEECQYPITRDVLVKMFNMVDRPVDVYCGPSGPTTTGEVEFASVESAERAMSEFNNKNIYPNCCLLRLSYAPPQDSSNNRGGDAGGFLSAPSQAVMPAPSNYSDTKASYQDDITYPAHPQSQQFQEPMGDRGRGFGVGRAGGVGGGGFTRGMGRGGRGGYDQGDFDPMRAPAQRTSSSAMPPPLPPPFDGRRPPFHAQRPLDEATVVVSNVTESAALYDLWVLLEVFGNVNSLKRQFKEKTNVAAQFQRAPDVKTAVFFLQGCPFRGRVLSLKLFVGYVERGGRVEWNAGPATDPATQAFLFTSGYHHRTKPSAPFNALGRVRPDKNLFLSNLVEAISDDEVKAEFAKAGVAIEGYYRKDSSAAILGFKDTETAIDALIAVHAKQLKDRFLRITFSRFPPGPREENANVGSGGGGGGGENAEDVARAIDGIQAEQHANNDGPAGEAEEEETKAVELSKKAAAKRGSQKAK